MKEEEEEEIKKEDIRRRSIGMIQRRKIKLKGERKRQKNRR